MVTVLLEYLDLAYVTHSWLWNHNISVLCPSFARILINTYREDSKLYIDGNYLLSQEGTTQGDRLAMPMYALGVVPLIQKLANIDVSQMWYADDASVGGSLQSLRCWWDHLICLGPDFGYFPNAIKTCLIVKPQHLRKARALFRAGALVRSSLMLVSATLAPHWALMNF